MSEVLSFLPSTGTTRRNKRKYIIGLTMCTLVSCCVGFVFLMLFLITKAAIHKSAKNQPMYSQSGLLELNSDNFDRFVYGQQKAFFIEFYSNWCGACKAYDPSWRKFVNDIRPWNSVVQPSAIDCGRSRNTGICREHSVAQYPSIKYFPYMSHFPADGTFYPNTPEYNLEKLTSDLAEMIVEDEQNQKPSIWPSFERINDLETIESYWSKNHLTYVAVIFEENHSYIANQIILDFVSFSKIAIVPASSQNRMLSNFDLAMPAMLVFQRGDNLKKPVFVSEFRLTRNLAKSLIRDVIEAVPELSTTTTEKPKATTPKIIDRSVQYQNHMTDLLSGLAYMCRHEIGLKQKINSTHMTSLKSFIGLLNKYFPGSSSVKEYLHRLGVWLDEKNEISGQEWIRMLDRLQKQLDNPLPHDITWVACRGSKPNYRGYPCALWTLFHTLTVQAYVKDGKSPTFSALEVLEAIHVYVRDFFACRECAEHFENGASKLPDVIKQPKDVVMWLWRAHNIPNKWLTHLPSEDPFFPKVQWPPPSLCFPCHNTDGSWNENKVLKFVVDYYSDIKGKKGKKHTYSGSVSNYFVKTAYGYLLFFLLYCL